MKMPSKSQITLILSILLNVLGGLGLVDPLPGVQCTQACPCPSQE